MFFHHLASLIPCPRWVDRCFVTVLAMAFCLMAIVFYVATPTDIAGLAAVISPHRGRWSSFSWQDPPSSGWPSAC